MRRWFGALTLLLGVATAGCGVFKKGEKKTPVLGERIAVLAAESDVSVDPATAAIASSRESAD